MDTVEDMEMDTSKIEKQREKIKLKKAGRISENCEVSFKGVTYA